MFLHALSCNTSENFIKQKSGVSDEMCCLSLPVSYQGRRDSLQWASFPETSRVFSFSAGMLILIKVEEMFHNMNFTLNFIHSVSCDVFSGLVEARWCLTCCCSVWALGAMSVLSRHVTICWYLVLRRSFCSDSLTFLWNVQFCWLFQLVNKKREQKYTWTQMSAIQ